MKFSTALPSFVCNMITSKFVIEVHSNSASGSVCTVSHFRIIEHLFDVFCICMVSIASICYDVITLSMKQGMFIKEFVVICSLFLKL